MRRVENVCYRACVQTGVSINRLCEEHATNTATAARSVREVLNLYEHQWTIVRFQLRWIIGYWVSCLIYTHEETSTLFEYNEIDNRTATCVIEKPQRNEK